MEAIRTGSEPLISDTTLVRSRSSPASGRPRSTASSNAKFGAAANVGPCLDSAASWRIQRCGLRTNETGDISVTCVPNTATHTIISRPMSWYSGSQLTLRMS